MTRQPARICVPICVSSVSDLERAISLACQAGDLIELRFDCLEPNELDQALERVRALLGTLRRPVIFTFRPAEQGGRRQIERESRRSFHQSPGTAAFYDVELDLAAEFAASDSSQSLIDWSTVICSHHDFVCVPQDLSQIYDRMASTPARVLKVAVQAEDVTDCLPIFNLLERAQGEGRHLIAIAMGTAGVVTRVLGPSRGAFLTYGALTQERGTAPGQPTASDLRDVYRIDQIDKQTLITGLVGLPVGHSISPQMHNAAFAALDLNAVYLPFEVHDVSAFLRRMVRKRTRELDWNLRGLSVTAPHKFAVMEHLDWIDPAAQAIGAVNTIVLDDDALLGYNTDAMAVLLPVIEKLGPLRDARCAVIGAGGVASAVLCSLSDHGAHSTLFARDEEKGRALARQFGSSYEGLAGAHWDGYDLVINATPLGTRATLEDLTPAHADQLRGARLAYDLVYNPRETLFMREARQAQCEAIGGLPMLVLQAAEQFRLWTGLEPSIAGMEKAAGRALNEQSAEP